MAARAGDPSEQELALRFNVSQGTVRKAIDEMAGENMVVRKQGKGTFVASHNDPRSLFRFLRLVPNDGDLSHPDSVPLECWKAKAGHEASRMLGVDPGALIIIVRRLLKFSGVPVVVDEIYLPGEIFQGLSSNCCRAGWLLVQSLRVPIRVAHDSRTGANPRRRRRSHNRRNVARWRVYAASFGGAGDLHVWRQTRRMASGSVPLRLTISI